ncbi:MAG: hypothetical protein WC758_01705 [Candidatus Woesearchaeota archaeon]
MKDYCTCSVYESIPCLEGQKVIFQEPVHKHWYCTNTCSQPQNCESGLIK